ncbi:MAG: alpha/beta fold hydrolase [Saprospiraceae bacterium]|nr:alpha/beta fold hydrolase [Saprospiraceae bacterium]
MIRYLLLCMIVTMSCSEKSSIKNIKEGTLSINGSEVYYRTIGKGNPIIIIHGGPVMDHSYLLPQMDQLSSDYQLIYYDQRACGKSSIDVDTSKMTLQAFADDVKLLSDSLKLEKPIVFGHSWGGLIAMKYATTYPDHVGKLILSNSIPANHEEWQEEQSYMEEQITADQNEKRSNILSSGELQSDPASAVKKLMLLSFENQFFDTTKMEKLQLNMPSDYMARSGKFQALAPDLVSFDLYSPMTYLEVPTLIIYGDNEPATAISAPHLMSHLADGKMEIIKRCGHFPFIEQPEVYFSIIRGFL